MVLVDTSVWIHFLANRPPYAQELDDLLSADEVAGHELIFGELLVGDNGARQSLLAAYECMRYAITVPHTEVVAFVRNRRLQACGAGWVDVHLLASALVSRVRLWTADTRLHRLCQEMGVCYNTKSEA